MQKVILVIVALFGVCSCIAKLPNYITLCKESEFSTCGPEAARAAIPYLWKGEPALRLLPVDPLLSKKIDVLADGSHSMRFNISFTDLTIRGMSTSEIKSMSIRDVGPVKRLKIVISPKYLTLKSHYKASGQILVLPLVGEGPCEIYLDNPSLTYEVDLKINKVKGQKRVMFVNLSTSHKAKKGSIRLENLFNGNKVLGENVNQVLNENWEAMDDQVGAPLFAGTVKEYIPFFVTVFNDIPYKSLFKEE